MNELVKRGIQEIKKNWYIPLIIIAGVWIMLTGTDRSEAIAVDRSVNDNDYVLKTEQRIVEMLKGIEGAGECRVTITLSSGGKKEYVREEGNVLVISDKDGNQSAVVSRENAPEIAGVTVACRGAGSAVVRNNIIESVSTVLGIGTNKICVVSISG